MKVIKNNISIEALWKDVIREAESCVLENVLINGDFNIDEIKSKFIKLSRQSAQDWQNKDRPKNLIINHGEYIYKGRNRSESLGIDFVLKELKRKNCGNRCCYSLINMEDIVGSGDDAIPSFMVLQFSFSNAASDKLLVSAYFRALEVSEFLRINLAEICLNIEEIKRNFPDIKTFELNIFAFRAQYMKDFNCLKHSTLDTLEQGFMVKYLLKEKYRIIDALKDKEHMVESVVSTLGMDNLKIAVDATDQEDLKNKETIQIEIDEILEIMNSIKTMRKSTSIQEVINSMSLELKAKINNLIKLMEEN